MCRGAIFSARKGLSLGLLALSMHLLAVNWAAAHDIEPGTCSQVSLNLSPQGVFAGTPTEAAVGCEGALIVYNITVAISAQQCPITDGNLTATLPNGNICNIATGISLGHLTPPGSESVTFLAQCPYTLSSANLGQQPGAAPNAVRTTFHLTSTSHRDSGFDQPNVNDTNYDTTLLQPNIAATKNCTPASGPGQPISFSGTVTNTGNTALTGVTVSDDHAGPVTCATTLAPGASCNYSGQYIPNSCTDDTDTVTTTASGVDPTTGLAFAPETACPASVTDSASATCPIPSAPAISVTKSCTPASGPGQPISFTGTVTNTGNDTLLNVTVVDDHAGAVSCASSLAAGASCTYSGSYTPTSCTDITDIVIASGT